MLGRRGRPSPSVPPRQRPPAMVAYLTSFGYLHGPAPSADILVDVREHLWDPHPDPEFRELTGKDPQVRNRVLATPGAEGVASGLVTIVDALMTPSRDIRYVVRVAVGCAGGRHRSVVLVDEVAARLESRGHVVHIHHRDLDKMVAARREG